MSLDLGRLGDERRRNWDAAMKRDDLLGETLRGLASVHYLVTGQVAGVEGGAFSATVNALGWYTANAPDKMSDVVARLAPAPGPETPANDVTDLMRSWATIAASKSANLVVNGGFEAAGRNEQRPEQDWKTEGAPLGWSTWSRDNKAVLRILPGKGCHESAAASIRNAGSACFLQNVPVRPGERYVCIAWAKIEPENLSANAKLAIRYRQKGGGWYPRQDAEPLVTALEGQAGWQLLTLVAKIPEGVSTLVVMLSANDQAEGAAALFDDVSLYKLP
jgi:hypothetical protein